MGSEKKSGLRFFELKAQVGANLMAAAIALGALIQGAIVLVFVLLPFIYAYNGGWSGFIRGYYSVVLNALFFVMAFVPMAIALLAPRVRGALMSQFGGSKKVESDDDDKEVPNVSRDAIGEMLGLCMASALVWGIFFVPTIIFTSWWNNMAGATSYFMDGTYAGVYTVDNQRGGTLWIFIVFAFCAITVMQLYHAMGTVVSYALHTSPREMVNGFNNLTGGFRVV